ncbi:protein PYRICULARIA ORYZAE RESISTANCE 21-like [Musa acuminata AAA Group]|uniref:protein PYRICULARIA ORYZAE RESISTANCE 21-like n=1 Tax=Musa acuminata AAA Group TaxID=214697 RepID=UPI0031DF5700
MAEKISTLILKVNLGCHLCYKKIRKTLRKLQDKENIKSISYDEKNGTVTISGPFDPHRLAKKLKCKACKVIEGIQIKEEKEKKPDEKQKAEAAKPADKSKEEPKQKKDDAGKKDELEKKKAEPEKKKAEPEPEPEGLPVVLTPYLWPPPGPVLCCPGPYYESYYGGTRCCSCEKVTNPPPPPPLPAYGGPYYPLPCEIVCEEDSSTPCSVM